MADSDYYDHQMVNGYDHDTPENKSQSFVVDLENFRNSANAVYFDDPIPTPLTTAGNSRLITLQRNLSRKGSFNFNRGNSIDNWKSTDRDNSNGLLASSSPKASQLGNSTPEKLSSSFTSAPATVVSTNMGSTTEQQHYQHQNSAVNPTPTQHQITIKTGGTGSINNAVNTQSDKRWARKSSSFKRSRFSNPKTVLLFFATLSSLGTLLLIYFTLTMSKSDVENTDLDWQQQ